MWLFLIVCLVAGWNVGNGLGGALVGLVIGAVIAVMFFGPALLLIDIRQSVRAIQARLDSSQ